MFPPYTVFHDTTLREMAARLPSDRQQLLRVQGVGRTKLATFGDLFLTLITDYVAETDAQPMAMPAPPQSRRPPALAPTARMTLKLFSEGQTPDAIAATRGLALSTVEEHLVWAMEAGERIDIQRLVSDDRRRAIEAAFEELGTTQLTPVMERLGDGYTYAELKYVRAVMTSGTHSGAAVSAASLAPDVGS